MNGARTSSAPIKFSVLRLSLSGFSSIAPQANGLETDRVMPKRSLNRKLKHTWPRTNWPLRLVSLGCQRLVPGLWPAVLCVWPAVLCAWPAVLLCVACCTVVCGLLYPVRGLLYCCVWPAILCVWPAVLLCVLCVPSTTHIYAQLQHFPLCANPSVAVVRSQQGNRVAVLTRGRSSMVSQRPIATGQALVLRTCLCPATAPGVT